MVRGPIIHPKHLDYVNEELAVFQPSLNKSLEYARELLRMAEIRKKKFDEIIINLDILIKEEESREHGNQNIVSAEREEVKKIAVLFKGEEGLELRNWAVFQNFVQQNGPNFNLAFLTRARRQNNKGSLFGHYGVADIFRTDKLSQHINDLQDDAMSLEGQCKSLGQNIFEHESLITKLARDLERQYFSLKERVLVLTTQQHSPEERVVKMNLSNLRTAIHNYMGNMRVKGEINRNVGLYGLCKELKEFVDRAGGLQKDINDIVELMRENPTVNF